MDTTADRVSPIPVSIVMAIYNAEETLPRCLSALADSTAPGTEIILVDNGSTDASISICEDFIGNHPELRVLLRHEKTPGPSAARNKGAKIAKGTWLIFTDADCVPDKKWISDFLPHLSDSTLGAIAGCIQPYSPSNVVQKALSLFTLPPIEQECLSSGSNLRSGFYPTANLAVRKDVFHLVGGFNSNLRYGEDHELCMKIYQAQYRIKAIVTAVVEHIHRSTVHGLLKQAFGFGSSHPFELRHFTPGRTIFSSPLFEFDKPTPGKWLWIDLNQADKKILISFLPGMFWPPFFLLPICYFIYLCFFVRNVGRKRKIETRILELPAIALLLLLKSIALGAGRFLYSFKHKVLCL